MTVSRRAGNPTGTLIYLTAVAGHFLQACLSYNGWTGNERYIWCITAIWWKPLPAPYVNMVSTVMHRIMFWSTTDYKYDGGPTRLYRVGHEKVARLPFWTCPSDILSGVSRYIT